MADYDVVVIGAGNGGLTAATTLARAGRKTLLLERHNIPGGCATSFVRGDFEFEVALHQLSGMGTPEQPFTLRNIFTDLGVMERVEFVQEPELYRVVTSDGLDITLPADWEELRAVLKQRFPAEAAAIDTFLGLCEVLTVESFLHLPGVTRSRDAEQLLQLCPHFVDYGLKTTREVFDELLTDEDLKAALGAYWGYLGLPASQLPFRDMAALIFAYCHFKPYHVVGGSQALSNALLDSFLEAGGEVRFNCGAEKILTEDGAVVAVRTEQGDTVSCDHVVSNASSIITYNELLDAATPLQRTQEEFRSCRIGTSGFVIYLGLDCTPQELGLSCATNFYTTCRDDDEVFARAHELSGPPMGGVLTCYNIDNPAAAPPGKSHVALMCLQHGAAWEDVAPEDYARVKYDYAQQLLDLAEQFFPGLRAHIEEVEVATPRTMMRYLNTPQGAIYGFNQDMYENPLFRERRQEVAGLHLAGCWVGMGGFQPSYQSGEKAAREIISQPQSSTTGELHHAG